MDKWVNVPQDLMKAPYNQSALQLNGFTVVEACTHVAGKKGSMFLDSHLLLFVLQGTYTIRYSKQVYTLRSNQMVLLKKAIVVEYDKRGDPDNDNLFEYMLFFLKDDFLKEFIKRIDLPAWPVDELVPVSIKAVSERMARFIDSLKPYFNEPTKIDAGLIKLKMLELLYDLADSDKNLLQQLLQLKKQVHSDLSTVLEANFMNPVSISDLAYLSGRSLSSFKRDFQAIYQMSPAQWIRQRRLGKAKELLSATALSVTDICYGIGFENITHFCRAFKSLFGLSPSAYRQQLELVSI